MRWECVLFSPSQYTGKSKQERERERSHLVILGKKIGWLFKKTNPETKGNVTF